MPRYTFQPSKSCTACGAPHKGFETHDTLPRSEKEQVLCTECGHLMWADRDVGFSDLTRAEAADIFADQEDFDGLREEQEAICRRMWG